MSSYKFGQVTVSSKPFYEAIDIDIKTFKELFNIMKTPEKILLTVPNQQNIYILLIWYRQ